MIRHRWQAKQRPLFRLAQKISARHTRPLRIALCGQGRHLI